MKRRIKNYCILFLGVVIICSFFALMETLHPYAFTKDDNLVQFLPSLLEGYGQLFSGTFPSINFHQYMGSPLFSTGTYAFFYPPLFISYLLAHFFFGNDYLLLEIFVLIHLIASFFVLFLFFRTKKIDPFVSMLASVAFLFSGYLLIATASWYYVIPTAFFLPLILFLSERLLRSNALWPAILLGVSKGVYFYSGNAQYMFFTLFFEIIYLIVTFAMAQKKDRVNALSIVERYLVSMVIMGIMILPLLGSQLATVHDSFRGERSFFSYLFSLPLSPPELVQGMLLPYPLVSSSHSFSYIGGQFISIYFSGLLFSLTYLFGIGYFVRKYRHRVLSHLPPSFLMSVLAIVLGMGFLGGLYLFGSLLPIVRNFSNPFKLTLFVNFFVILFGAEMLSSFLSFQKKRAVWRRNFFLSLFTVIFLALLTYHVFHASALAWSYYGDTLPLAPLPYASSLEENYRLVSYFEESSYDPRQIKTASPHTTLLHAPFLTQNFATYYQLDSLGGYEPFIDKTTTRAIPLDRFGAKNVLFNETTLEEYGVRYILAPSDITPSFERAFLLSTHGIVSLYELPSPRPLVFVENGEPLSFSREEGGLKIYTNFSQEQRVTINFLFKEGYHLKEGASSIPLLPDNYGRITFLAPEGERTFSVSYSVESLLVLLVLSTTILVFLMLYLLYRDPFLLVLDKARLPSFLLALSKRKVFFFLGFLFLILLALLGNATLRPQNVESIAQERLHLPLEIKETSFSPFSLTYVLSDVKIRKGETVVFSAQKIILRGSILSTLQESYSRRKPILVFDSVRGERVIILLPEFSPTPSPCPTPFKSTLLFSEDVPSTLSFPSIDIERIFFSPLTEIEADFSSDDISGKVLIEKYVSGEITLGEGTTSLTTDHCVVLPLRETSLLYLP